MELQSNNTMHRSPEKMIFSGDRRTALFLWS